jgi:predicted glycosyltransferase
MVKSLPTCNADNFGATGLDDAQTVRHDWNAKGVYGILENLYSEIWIYGNREFYDPIHEYAISESISRKIHFTGYIPRKVPNKNVVQNTRKEQGLEKTDKLVVVTTKTAHPLLRAF